VTTPVPYTPATVPPDTDRVIYRYVTRFRGDNGPSPQVESVLTQIFITQP
jgi:hypothetical protein